ncbi:RICIN domain-containing protein [Streptomyces sp. NBC_00433]
MKTHKRWAAVLGALAVGAGLMSGSSTPAVAHDASGPSPPAVVAQQFSLRLAGHPGQVANVRGASTENDAPVIQYDCGTADNELWRFVPKGIGYQIVAKSSGKCLNVRGGVGVGNPLIQYTCTAAGVDNDVWLPVWEPDRP